MKASLFIEGAPQKYIKFVPSIKVVTATDYTNMTGVIHPGQTSCDSPTPGGTVSGKFQQLECTNTITIVLV